MSATATAAPAIGVGMLGAGRIGRVHAHAYRVLADAARTDAADGREPGAVLPRLAAVAGRRREPAAPRYGFQRRVGDWRELLADPAVRLFDNCGPNDLHGEPTIAAAEAGRHVLCEKPLGRDAEEAFEIWRRVAATGVRHMCAFNYRFVPAIRLARELVADGELGEVLHLRARFLQSWGLDALDDRAEAARGGWRADPARAGSGALGDLGSHLVDLARQLAGEPVAVTGQLTSFRGAARAGAAVGAAPPRGAVDDAFAATVRFASGAAGTLEASRCVAARRTALAFEVDGTRGSLAFDLGRLNELRLTPRGGPARTAGTRTIAVTAAGHPTIEPWWPAGRVVGWQHAFVAQQGHLLEAIARGTGVAPVGATFEDGYRAAEVCDAIARAAASGTRQQIGYRTLDGARAGQERADARTGGAA